MTYALIISWTKYRLIFAIVPNVYIYHTKQITAMYVIDEKRK